MAFLPFYVPASGPIKVAIVGGGYAALAALVSLHRFSPYTGVTLIDPNDAHIKVTHLHETFRRRLREFVVPFEKIEQRFNCRHVRAAVEITDENLMEWQEHRGLAVGDEFIDFDYLLVAIGSGTPRLDQGDAIYDLRDFMTAEGSSLMQQVPIDGDAFLTVVGGGATGIQFLFEIAEFVRVHKLPFRIRLVDGEDTVLKQFTPALGRYVESRLSDAGIEHLPRTFYRKQEGGQVRLENRDTGDVMELNSSAAFLFPGKASDPLLNTTFFGQVVAGGRVLDRVFAAGDCSHHRGVGSNTVTAQAAVRKGKLAARNILRSSGRLKVLEPYLHRDLGYVVSLGPNDAIGWLGLEGNIVAGVPALVVKELVEAQYDLLMAGIDTYLI